MCTWHHHHLLCFSEQPILFFLQSSNLVFQLACIIKCIIYMNVTHWEDSKYDHTSSFSIRLFSISLFKVFIWLFKSTNYSVYSYLPIKLSEYQIHIPTSTFNSFSISIWEKVASRSCSSWATFRCRSLNCLVRWQLVDLICKGNCKTNKHSLERSYTLLLKEFQ